MEDTLDQFIQSRMKTVQKYCQLAARPMLSELEADQLDAILELAQSDGLLNFLINEADHFMAHALNLLDAEFIQKQQVHLKQSLIKVLNEPDLGWAKEVNRRRIKTFWIQQQLKNKGFDPGPIDGIYGSRTKAAVEAFCQARNLDVQEVGLQESPDNPIFENLWIQQELKHKGFDPGPIDGINGPLTKAAIQAFCQAKNIDTAEMGIQQSLADMIC